MNEIKQDQIPEQQNFVAGLANGDFGLAMTYWVYGVLGGVIWGVGILALGPESDLTSLVWYPLVLYYFVVYAGIWQAASKYTGSKIWAILAKFAVIVVVVPAVIHILKFLADR